MRSFIRNGRPYGPSVNKLDEHFAELNRGDELRHEDVERIIGEQRASARYQAVVRVWRKRVLRTRKLWIATFSPVGFRVTTEIEQLQAGASKVKTARRFVVNAGAITEFMDASEEHAKSAQTRQLAEIRSTAESVESAHKVLSVLHKPFAALPRGR